jgi:hypothetical protein
MIVTGQNLYRVLADGLICRAEELPRRHPGAQCLRDAAASLLDADMHLNAANDHHTPDQGAAA